MFSNSIYESWKKLQLAKYQDLFPKIQEHLQNNWKVLDFGIGKAWFEEYLAERDFVFQKVIGFDVSEKAVSPKKEGIEYILSEKLETDQKFDFVIAFDSLHKVEDPKEILQYAKQDALILISTPDKFRSVLEPFNEFEKLAFGEIGDIEKDFFILFKKTS